MKLSILLWLTCIYTGLAAQEKIILNGGFINIQNGAYVVIQKNGADAITKTNADGGLVMNDASSRLRWHIGAGSATYTIPFVLLNTAIPLAFTSSGGSSFGYFDFTTYQTNTWRNADFLPPGITNVHRGAVDNSLHLIDRFWMISAQGYTTKPTLNNVSFGYRDAEWNTPGNSIAEVALKAQRWNNILNTWNDFAPAGMANISTNTVVVASLASSQLFDWWTLVDADFPLPLQLLSFTAQAQNNTTVKAAWKTSSETNTSHFVVERSTNGTQFYEAGRVSAAGNSTTECSYTFMDVAPYKELSIYRLKIVDNDSSIRYSNVVPVSLRSAHTIHIYPNPVIDYVSIESGTNAIEFIVLTDAMGKVVMNKKAAPGTMQLNFSNLASGTYWLKLVSANETKTFKLIKAPL